jgi:hypothetical protein
LGDAIKPWAVIIQQLSEIIPSTFPSSGVLMKDYSAWKEKTLSVTSLHLDPKNPRIPELGHEPTQRDIVAELVEHDNVYELAKDISDQGYFPTELLVGVVEQDQEIVVEGNRRLAALKLLLSPDLAPEKHIRKFRLLQGNVSPKQLRGSV